MSQRPSRKERERGTAVIEVSLMAPWLFFLFAGVVNLGFYTYAAISIENASRVAALYTSSSPATAGDNAGACTYAVRELGALPLVTPGMACNALPVIVSATAVNGPDNKPATSVTVTYQTLKLFAIPGMGINQLTLSRTAVMKVKGN
jgi:Flp pilus assembly protein TadG